MGSALFAFVFTVVTDERWQKDGKDPLVQLPPVDGAVAPKATARRIRPGTSAAELTADNGDTESAYLAGDYSASDYEPLYVDGGDSEFEPGSIDWLVPNQFGAAGGIASSGAGGTRNASMNAGSGSGSAGAGGGGASGGRGGMGGFGVGAAGAGAGPDSDSGDSGREPSSSEEPGERSIFTGLDVAPSSSADDISEELEGLGAPNFASLPANFDPCSAGGLVVSPCVTPPAGPCPVGDASCGGGEPGSGTRNNVASVNGTGGGTGGESTGSGGGESGSSGASGGSGESGESGSTGESGGTGQNGGETEGVHISSTPVRGGGDGGGNNEGDSDERRTPFASSDLRPLLISGGTNPDLTNGDGDQGDGDNALLATASSSATVPVPAPALLLAFGIALLARRR